MYGGDKWEKVGFEEAAIFGGNGADSICGDEEPPESIFKAITNIQGDLQLIARDLGFVRESTG